MDYLSRSAQALKRLKPCLGFAEAETVFSAQRARPWSAIRPLSATVLECDLNYFEAVSVKYDENLASFWVRVGAKDLSNDFKRFLG